MLAGSNEAAMGSATAVVVCGLALTLVCIALFCYGSFRTFSKMGLPGWQGFVPILGTVRGLERAANRTVMLVILGIRVVAYVVTIVSVTNDRIRIFVTFLALFVILATHAAEGFLVARRFGFGVAFGLMCGILPPVFMFILGVSDAQFGDDELALEEDEELEDEPSSVSEPEPAADVL